MAMRMILPRSAAGELMQLARDGGGGGVGRRGMDHGDDSGFLPGAGGPEEVLLSGGHVRRWHEGTAAASRESFAGVEAGVETEGRR